MANYNCVIPFANHRWLAPQRPSNQSSDILRGCQSPLYLHTDCEPGYRKELQADIAQKFAQGMLTSELVLPNSNQNSGCHLMHEGNMSNSCKELTTISWITGDNDISS